MKKTTTLLCLGMAFCLAACSDDDNKVSMPETQADIPFTLTATLPVRSTDTTEDNNTWKGTWNDNSQLAVLKTTTAKTPKAILTKLATSIDQFTGEISSKVYNESELAIFYPASALTMSSSDTLTQTLPLTGQDGTLEGVNRYDYAWATAKASIKDKTGSAACEMKPLMTIGKFQFTTNGTTPLTNIARITVTATSGTLYSSALLQLKDGKLHNLKTGHIVLQNPEGLPGTAYISFFPGEAQLHFTLVTADQKVYETNTAGSVLLEKGKLYTSPALNCTPLQPAHIGDYYYSDATYSSVKDKQKNCIGIVYALDDAQGNLLKGQTSSPYGRIVALKDNQSRVKWTNGKATDLEGIPNDTTLNGSMLKGALPYYKGTAESYFTDKADEQIHGVTIDAQTGLIAAWVNQGVLSDFQGKKHTDSFNSRTTTYPAGGHCNQYTTEGTSAGSWYLPSAGELALLWELYRSGILCEDTKPGFHDFAEKSYWTSSEHSTGKAWYINFISGYTVANSKNSLYATRPVSRF